MAGQTVLVTGSGGVRRVIRASTGQLLRGHRASFPIGPRRRRPRRCSARWLPSWTRTASRCSSFAAAGARARPSKVRELQQSAGLPLGAPRYALGPVRELLRHEPRDRWPENLDLVTFGGAMRGDPP
jgi:hypothetical protein